MADGEPTWVWFVVTLGLIIWTWALIKVVDNA